MRLGSVIYIIPFLFVLDVAFILKGSGLPRRRYLARRLWVCGLSARFAGLYGWAGSTGFPGGAHVGKPGRLGYCYASAELGDDRAALESFRLDLA